MSGLGGDSFYGGAGPTELLPDSPLVEATEDSVPDPAAYALDTLRGALYRAQAEVREKEQVLMNAHEDVRRGQAFAEECSASLTAAVAKMTSLEDALRKLEA